MKVILLQDVKGVGRRFEEKEVSSGYAANFLIPKKLALSANASSAGNVKALKEQSEKSVEKKRELLLGDVLKVSGKNIKVEVNANELGHLFASITKEKISEILKKEGIEIDSEHILAKPIKEIGTFEVPISVGGGKETKFTLEVVPA